MADATSPEQPTDSEQIAALRLELRLKEETHLAVVRRLQQEIDALTVALEESRGYERSAALQAHERYENEQREADRLHTQCGGNDGPY